MKTRFTFSLLLSFLTSFMYSFGQYSNATLDGAWLSYAENHVYYIFDGNGNIEEMSSFGGVTGSNIGTYSVNSSGAITGNISVYSINFTGQFHNSDSADMNITGMGTVPLYRVTSPGALTDTLTGTFVYDTNSVIRNVQFVMNSSGQIVSATGLPGVTGKIFTENGVYAGHISTTDNTMGSCWLQMVISGTYTGDTLAGEINFDCNIIGGSMNLVRSGNATLTSNSNQLEQLDFSFYPNPFSHTLYLENHQNKPLSAKVIDLFGKVVFEGSIHTSIGTIDGLDGLNPGMYILQVTQNNTTQSFKILKK